MASPVPSQPPGIRTISSPPPPWKPWRPPPSWTPWRSPPSRTNPMDKSTSEGGVIAGLVIGIMASLLLFTVVWSTWKARRDSRSRAGAGAGSAAGPWAPFDDDDQQLRRASTSAQTACLPAFTYSPAVKHNVTDDGEEAATCSVCLGAFQLGETVRLLPVCLHLYHVECIDPWLDAHSTCPLCRSDTDASMEMDAVARLPPV